MVIHRSFHTCAPRAVTFHAEQTPAPASLRASESPAAAVTVPGARELPVARGSVHRRGSERLTRVVTPVPPQLWRNRSGEREGPGDDRGEDQHQQGPIPATGMRSSRPLGGVDEQRRDGPRRRSRRGGPARRCSGTAKVMSRLSQEQAARAAQVAAGLVDQRQQRPEETVDRARGAEGGRRPPASRPAPSRRGRRPGRAPGTAPGPALPRAAAQGPTARACWSRCATLHVHEQLVTSCQTAPSATPAPSGPEPRARARRRRKAAAIVQQPRARSSQSRSGSA